MEEDYFIVKLLPANYDVEFHMAIFMAAAGHYTEMLHLCVPVPIVSSSFSSLQSKYDE